MSSVTCVVTLFLAAFGVVSSIAMSFNRRRYEFGLRLAFGATFGNLVKELVGNVVAVVAVSGIVGIAASLAALRILQHHVAGIARTPFTALGALDAILLLLACITSLIAARMYVRLTPTNLLRSA